MLLTLTSSFRLPLQHYAFLLTRHITTRQSLGHETTKLIPLLLRSSDGTVLSDQHIPPQQANQTQINFRTTP